MEGCFLFSHSIKFHSLGGSKLMNKFGTPMSTLTLKLGLRQGSNICRHQQFCFLNCMIHDT